MIRAVTLALNDRTLTRVERFQRCDDLASLIEGGHVLVTANQDFFDVVAAPIPTLPPLPAAIA